MNITVNRQGNPAYEAMLNDLVMDVFGFSFAPWFDLELWDEQYESYSIIDNGRMLSNVCIYKTDFIILGRCIRAHQFGAIATREGERKKGLSRLLVEHVLSLYPDIPSFLYANPSVAGFYPRLGFRQAKMYRPMVNVTINNAHTKAIKGEPTDDFVIEAIYGERVDSDMVRCLNTQSVQVFHLLMHYSDGIYFLPDCGALVVTEQEGNRLFLADVITQRPITFDTLKKELPFTGIEVVEFGFCPDWLSVSPNWVRMDWVEEPFFLMGEWDLPEMFRFPSMSAT